jgi:hypothetical protein
MANSPKSKSWRDALPIHPAAELFPLMDEAELGELARDIKKHALRERPVFYDDPELGICVLDGRNRLDAFERIGREVVNADGQLLQSSSFSIIKGGRSFDPVAFVLSKNLHRRHLSAEDKRDLIAKLVKAKPEASNLQIAKQIKADDKTVAKVRSELEGRSEIPNVKTRTDTRGRKQAAHKSAGRRPSGRRQIITELNSLAWSNANQEKRTKFVSDVGLVHIWKEADEDQRLALETSIDKIVDQHLKDEKDEDVFTAIVTELARLTKKNNPERFGNTSLPFKDLRELGHFFLNLALVCERKCKAEIDAKRAAEVDAILAEAAS